MRNNIFKVAGDKGVRIRPERRYLNLLNCRANKEGPGSTEGPRNMNLKGTPLKDIVAR